MTQAPVTSTRVPAGGGDAPAPGVRVLGVRHHGPGSAQAVARALDDYRPTVVLIEGPADATALVRWLADAGLVPPVALLAWDVAEPARSAFWPLATFSPEWQALSWATTNAVPARFVDLPSSLVLARPAKEGPADVAGSDDVDEPESAGCRRHVRADPIARLAELAGHDDPEAWWEDAIELRPAGDAFAAIADAMGELRSADGEQDRHTLIREAHMRQQVRAAQREGHPRIAVVCGAWHAPALTGKLPPASADAALLRGLPKTKTDLTWAPWTHSRLAFSSGYGAGVTSPGWYHHLFTAPDRPVERWLATVAGVLRDHDLPVSTAHVIEGVRLADALAALRGRPLPGLSEVTEATWSVLCEGNPVTLELVTREAVIGEALGEVPAGVPMVPLDADLRGRARTLRLAFAASIKVVTLDLRKDHDLAKSHLLRQLGLLGIPWGRRDVASGTGTFKEVWQLAWQPEFAVRVIEAARFGNTVPAAATAALLAELGSLGVVTRGIEQALLAGLDDALPTLLGALDERAAHEADVAALLTAVPPLVRVQRYGDVRRIAAGQLADVTRAILSRACAALPPACSALAEDAARTLRSAIDGVQSVLTLVEEALQQEWFDTLLRIAARRDVPGILGGRVVRLLLDAGRVSPDEAAVRLARVLSHGTEPAAQAGWVEGFLAGSPLLVIHDDRLLALLDDWMATIGPDAFTDVLPILRRTFGTWDAAARRQLADRVAALGLAGPATAREPEDFADVEAVLATVALVLGAGKESSDE